MLTREEAEEGGMKQCQGKCLSRALRDYYGLQRIKINVVESMKTGMCDDVHVKDTVLDKETNK